MSRSVQCSPIALSPALAGVKLPQNHEEPHGHRQSPEA